MIKDFVGVTQVSEKVAKKMLTDADWNLESAMNQFWDSGASTESHGMDEGTIEQTFAKYADADEPEMMYADGVLQFCEDLDLEPTDILVLAIAWKFDAKDMSQFSKEEFVSGMKRIGVNTVSELKSSLPSLKADLEDDHAFREFYSFSYDFGVMPREKKLGPEMARNLWGLLLDGRWSRLGDWLEFVESEVTKPIIRDWWMCVLDFSLEIDHEFTKYKEEDAWPLLMDDFQLWVQEKEKNEKK